MAALPGFDDLFELEEIIGSGLTCVVYTCREIATGQKYAVKVIDLKLILGQLDEEERIGRIKREIQLLNQVDHPGIIKLHKVYSAPRSKLFLVLELCQGGELCDLLLKLDGHLSEKLTRAILIQIVDAVAYLHSKAIAHRDLKMENILLKEPYSPDAVPQIKIVDFGFARQLEHTSESKRHRSPLLCNTPKNLNLSFVGTIAYAAPEMISHKSYDCRCDLYSVGVLLYFCLVGSLPFATATLNGTTTLDLREALSFQNPVWNDISPEARDLVRHLLVDEYERFSAAEFLSHPWCSLKTEPPVEKGNKRQIFHRYKQSLKASTNKLIDFKRGTEDELVEQVGSELRSSRSKPAPRITVQDSPSHTKEIDFYSDSSSDSDTSSFSSSPSPNSSPFISPSHSPPHSPSLSPRLPQNSSLLAVPAQHPFKSKRDKEVTSTTTSYLHPINQSM